MTDVTSTNLADVSPPFFTDMTGWNEHELSEDFRDFALAQSSEDITEMSHVGSQVNAIPTNGSLFDQVPGTEKSLVIQESTSAVPKTLFDLDLMVSTSSNKLNGKGKLNCLVLVLNNV